MTRKNKGFMRLPGKALLVLVCWIVTLLPAGCGDTGKAVNDASAIKTACSHDVNQFILDKLRANRVVMIGDEGHSVYLYRRTIRDFLHDWIDQIEAGDNTVPTKLLLVFEMDPSRANRIKAAAINYQAVDCLDADALFSRQYTVGTFQFHFHDLRRILQRVAAYNGTAGRHDSLFLDIVGPEETFDPDNWSRAKRDSLYVRDRDRRIASRVIDAMEARPDFKGLVFYGGSHLLRFKTLKRAGNFQDSAFYMGHYLTEHFANRGGVYTIYQSYIKKPDIQPHRFMSAPESTYAIDNRYLDLEITSADLQHSYNIRSFDGSIIYFDRPVEDAPLLHAWSRSIVDYILSHAREYDSLTGELSRIIRQPADRYLRTISAEEYKLGAVTGRWEEPSAEDWIEWGRTAHIDVVADISSLALWRRLIDRMAAADGKFVNWYESLFTESLNMIPYRDTVMSPHERAEVYREFIEQDRDRIVIENLIRTACVGTAPEVAEAIIRLKQMTGLDFDSPEAWADWWRGEKAGLR